MGFKIIFSPSKEMNNENIFKNLDIDFEEIIFEKKNGEIFNKLKTFSEEEVGKIMKIKNVLLNESFKNIQNFERLDNIPALSLYNGVAFKELEREYYSKEELEYISNRLFIMSAFYGVSKPFSLIKKYRLDMTMKIFEKSLYDFWKKEINDYIEKELNNNILINLASEEFSKLIDKKRIKNIINIDFKEFKNEKYSSVSSYSKQARGKFLNTIIKNKIDKIEDLKKISFSNYELNENLSDEKNFIFTR